VQFYLALLPATELTVAMYLMHRLNTGAMVSIIKSSSSVRAYAHTTLGVTSPTVGLLVAKVREYARRHAPAPQRVKDPVAPEAIKRIMTHVFWWASSTAQSQKAYVVAIMYFALL
jgi:hypothetical protein